MSCPACGAAEQAETQERCVACHWRLEGPLAQILTEIQRVSEGGDLQQGMAAIRPLLKEARLTTAIGDMVLKLFEAGNPDRAARMIIEEGQQRGRGSKTSPETIKSLLTALAAFGVFSALYVVVGVPAPIGWFFNIGFILMGSAFCGFAASGFLNPKSITVGHTTGSQLSPQQFTNGRSATKGQGIAWAVIMLAAGLGICVFGLLAGLFI